MKLFFIILTTIVYLNGCEPDNNYYNIIGDEQMETEACEMIDSCSNQDFEPIGLTECKSRDYSKDCLIAIIESENCVQARNNFQNICENNSSIPNTEAEEICDKIRINCGFDNSSQQTCLDEHIPTLGAEGQSCIQDTNNCDEVITCMNDYL